MSRICERGARYFDILCFHFAPTFYLGMLAYNIYASATFIWRIYQPKRLYDFDVGHVLLFISIFLMRYDGLARQCFTFSRLFQQAAFSFIDISTAGIQRRRCAYWWLPDYSGSTLTFSYLHGSARNAIRPASSISRGLIISCLDWGASRFSPKSIKRSALAALYL